MLLKIALFHSFSCPGSHRVGCDWSDSAAAAAAAVHGMYVSHLYLFICWWTFGCFHILVTGNSAAVNTGVRVSFQSVVFSRYMPRSGVAGSYGNSQCFKEPPYWLHQITFPPTVQEGSLLSTPSPAFIICRLFDDGHSDWCEVIT